MQSEVKLELTAILKLDKAEARWLKEIVQNPLGGISPAEEDPINKDMRSRFWEALKEVS